MAEPQNAKNTSQLREAIDAYAVDFALLLAGWVTFGQQDVEPFSTDQIVVAAASSIGAFAKTRADYDPTMDITEAVQLTVHTYAEAMKANLISQLEEIEQQELEEDQASGHVSDEELELMKDFIDGDPSVLGELSAVEHEEDDVERASGAVAPR